MVLYGQVCFMTLSLSSCHRAWERSKEERTMSCAMNELLLSFFVSLLRSIFVSVVGTEGKLGMVGDDGMTVGTRVTYVCTCRYF